MGAFHSDTPSSSGPLLLIFLCSWTALRKRLCWFLLQCSVASKHNHCEVFVRTSSAVSQNQLLRHAAAEKSKPGFSEIYYKILKGIAESWKEIGPFLAKDVGRRRKRSLKPKIARSTSSTSRNRDVLLVFPGLTVKHHYSLFYARMISFHQKHNFLVSVPSARILLQTSASLKLLHLTLHRDHFERAMRGRRHPKASHRDLRNYDINGKIWHMTHIDELWLIIYVVFDCIWHHAKYFAMFCLC